MEVRPRSLRLVMRGSRDVCRYSLSHEMWAYFRHRVSNVNVSRTREGRSFVLPSAWAKEGYDWQTDARPLPRSHIEEEDKTVALLALVVGPQYLVLTVLWPHRLRSWPDRKSQRHPNKGASFAQWLHRHHFYMLWQSKTIP